MFFSDPVPLHRSKHAQAFVFYATDETYAMSVLVFVHLLRELGGRSDVDIVVLHAPLSPQTVEGMRRMGIATILVRRFPRLKDPYYGSCLLKLKIFQLVAYERIVFCDGDAVPLKNLDDLFSLPLAAPIAAPRAYWLDDPCWTSALLVLQPSLACWKRLKRHFGGAGRRKHFDMDIINLEFAGEIQTLPPSAFCLNSEWTDASRPGFLGDQQDAYTSVSVVHFSDLGKPWRYSGPEARILRPKAHRAFYELWDRWRAARDVVLKQYPALAAPG
jgi:hypothetical protein